VLPDVLTNAGGVTVSYFEWVQDLGRLFWTRDEIRAKLAEKLSDAFDRVWDLAEDRKVPLRTGALVAGIREVSDALQARGHLPVSVVRDAMVSNPGSCPRMRPRRQPVSSCSGRRCARSTSRTASVSSAS
jgi:hypothetical protein